MNISSVLELFREELLLEASNKIDLEGIPKKYLLDEYWVKFPNDNEYPLGYLVKVISQHNLEEDINLDLIDLNVLLKHISTTRFSINRYEQQIPFFTSKDIEHFGKNAGKPYRSANLENRRDADLLYPLTRKLNIWASNSIIEDFKYRKDHGWQWSGTFKDYLWVRIFRKNSSQKVFFVLVVASDGLLYKIDCLRSNHSQGTNRALSKQQIQAFDNYLMRPEVNYQEVFIRNSDIHNYSWEELIELTRGFISNYSACFDDLESIVSLEKSELITSPSLELGEAPERVISRIPKKRSYKGQIVNWEKKHNESARLGLSGELLVIKIEKEKLESNGLFRKAEEVRKVLDGNGYDIRSFDANGGEVHIEVKTTTRSIQEPFYMSINERDFMLDHPGSYLLYRLYEYDFSTNSAKHYILTAEDLNEFVFTPTSYEVSIDKK